MSATAAGRLASAVADLLRDVVPAAVSVEADGPDVVVRWDSCESRNGTAVILDSEDGRSFSERVAAAALAMLNHVQDAAADATGEPWPASGATLPLPRTEVVGRVLRTWFGDPDAPVLVLDDLDLAALEGGGPAA